MAACKLWSEPTIVANPSIIVVGASAGGVEELQHLAAGLPATPDASIFVVLHIGSGINGQSHLPAILSNAGKLPAVEERQGRIVEYTCRVGHRYSPLALEAGHRLTTERSLGHLSLPWRKRRRLLRSSRPS
jgi:chemotaxis response regulator CheB